MIFVKLLLYAFVLNISEGGGIGIDFYAFAFQFFQGLHVYAFYFKSKQIYLFSEVIDSIIIHQVTLLKMVCGYTARGFCTGIENAGADVPLTGFVKHHFAQLSAA